MLLSNRKCCYLNQIFGILEKLEEKNVVHDLRESFDHEIEKLKPLTLPELKTITKLVK